MVIKFPSDLDWYKEQPCTMFQTLHHRKERTGFRHEYIVLQLLDGSICRLERMGDPHTRLEALSAHGITAHDMAECFRPESLSKASLEGTDIITELTFPEPFDLMDVLRVCRAIQEGEKTCQYTLLSSNCYFFCLAIQACLTRLVVDWKVQRPLEDWISTLGRSVKSLAQTLQTPNCHKPLLLRIYSALSSSEGLVNGIVEEVVPMLNASLIRSRVNQALEAELWYSNLEDRADLVLENMMKEAVVRALEKTSKPQQGIQLDLLASGYHSMTSESATHWCKQAVTRLVSLAAADHGEQAGSLSIQKAKAYLCRASTSALKPDRLGFRPPCAPSQSASYSLNRVRRSIVWIQHVLIVTVWFLNIAAGFFWIGATRFDNHSQCMLIDEDINLALDGLPKPHGPHDVCEILQRVLQVYEARKWSRWPWAFLHDLTRQQPLEYARVRDPLLKIIIPVGSSSPLSQLVYLT